ncbi:hypothetical protein [Streptomyces albipurpureus]|uniref:Uncharacterized protein n=1 Tax=Streptomyces albipurpureus TaxID=2897419 RepID=A0ABT0UZX7_9ACTN|nr:hypothetical protein [Streptomyces sp. CWNU-1]MCM2392711.1 hypothetical protein [Streptomyces sp. CWNU-1]
MTAQHAHSLLLSITQASAPASTEPKDHLAAAGRESMSPAPHPLPHIPLQQRLRELPEATGMTTAELARPIRDLDPAD